MDVRFTKQADDDIIDSYLYGFLNFGREQADRYEQSLRHVIGLIAENPRIAFIRMCQMYKLNALPAMTDQDIYNEIKQAVDIIFQLKRTPSGRCLQSVYFNVNNE